MADETGRETARSDDPSAGESLFGDAVDDAAAAVSEEEESKGGNARDPQGPADAEEQAGQPEDLKVVVSINGGRATIGVQRTSSDPYIESFDDRDLSGLAREASSVVERARVKWEDAPRYPVYERPAPPARRRNRREHGSAQAVATEGETSQQQPEPPRLF